MKLFRWNNGWSNEQVGFHFRWSIYDKDNICKDKDNIRMREMRCVWALENLRDLPTWQIGRW